VGKIVQRSATGTQKVLLTHRRCYWHTEGAQWSEERSRNDI